MAEYSGEQAIPARTEHLPGWVIEHMIKLTEYAAFSGLSAFEAKLLDATEVLLQELADTPDPHAKVENPDVQPGSNVIAFVPATGTANPHTKARRGTGRT